MTTINQPGFFGEYGGQYIPETLVPVLANLTQAMADNLDTPAFKRELADYYTHYIGRPSPLYHAKRLTDLCGGAQIFFKRDELNHTGAHKINNCVGQLLLAKYMKKTRIIAETGAGQHGVATATVCALFGLPCVVYMGAKDIERQKPNVSRMRLLGATIVPVTAGQGTLKDAMNEAIRDWVANVDTTYYAIGTAAGPHPYPTLVRHFQSIIGQEVKTAFQSQFNALPDTLVACLGGGSNAIGLFAPFLEDATVNLVGVEPDGAAPLAYGKPGVLHGNKTYLLQDEHGQIANTHSISAGLDYPGIGPEHSYLKDTGRVTYTTVTDSEALAAFQQCAQYEGIIPALEPAHALAHVLKLAPTLSQSHRLVMNLCGRGDKDLDAVANHLGWTA